MDVWPVWIFFFFFFPRQGKKKKSDQAESEFGVHLMHKLADFTAKYL